MLRAHDAVAKGNGGVLAAAVADIDVSAGDYWAWGSETRIRSRGGAVVLVDEPTEQVQPALTHWASDRLTSSLFGFGQALFPGRSPQQDLVTGR